ncbi:MAG: diguanylate cyclase [Candidatus Altiarchaeota archaeon]
MTVKTKGIVVVGKERVDAALKAQGDELPGVMSDIIRGRRRRKDSAAGSITTDIPARLFEMTESGVLNEVTWGRKTITGLNVGEKLGEPSKKIYPIDLGERRGEIEVQTTGRTGTVTLSGPEGEEKFELVEDMRSTRGDELEEDNKRLREDLKTAAELNDPTKSLDAMNRTLLDAVNRLVGSEASTLFLVGSEFLTAEKKELERFTLADRQIRAATVESAIVKSIISGRTARVDEGSMTEEDRKLLGKKPSSLFVIPIAKGAADKRQVMGALVVEGSKKDQLSSADMSSIEYLANHAASEVFSERLNQVDAITNLVPRGLFDRIYESLIGRAVTERVNLTVGVTDVDRFSQVSNNIDHARGSEVIKQIGTVIKSNISNERLAGAFGGDEMRILFRESKEESLKQADKIRSAIEAHSFYFTLHPEEKDIVLKKTSSLKSDEEVIRMEHEDGKDVIIVPKGSEVLENEDGSRIINLPPGTFTVSIGLATLRDDVNEPIQVTPGTLTDTRRKLTNIADKQLKAAKKAGKNCVKAIGSGAIRAGDKI